MRNLFKQPGPRSGPETIYATDVLQPGESHRIGSGVVRGSAGDGVNGRPTLSPTELNHAAPIFRAIDSALARVSTNSAGEQASHGSFEIAFAPGGTHVAFTSEGRNLVAGDNNNRFDIFVKNLATGAVTRVSTDAAGAEGNEASISSVFLPGGDKIAFISGASNLVAGDTNNLNDIFIKDLATGAITRVSTNSDGSQLVLDDRSYASIGIGQPSFSPDGTKMAFAFHNGAAATIYIKDLVTGTLTVAVGSAFAESVNAPEPQFSPDGTKLLYRSYDTTTGIFHIFLKDLASGTVSLVSANSAGQAAAFHSEDARFSGDGTHIVFASVANNLVAGDTNGFSDIFVKDLITGAVTAVSVNAAGVLAGGYRPVISPDGTKVAFTAGSLMVPGDNNSFPDIVVKDLLTGQIVLLSVRADGSQSSSASENAVFSPDGTSVGFYSDMLVYPDTNGSFDVYMARLGLPAVYVEGGPAAQIVPIASALDPGSANYNNGSLTVAITAGSVAGDQLSLALSNLPGESIAMSGNQVLVNAVMVGTIASSATGLTISFNASATNAVVELLTEAVRISSTSDNPTAAIRTVTFTLVDGGGTEGGAQDTAFFTRKVAFVPVDGQHMIGTAGNDILVGGTGNDTLDGGSGADDLSGGQGNDIYIVDNGADFVRELLGEGADLVRTSVSYALAAGQEIETLSTGDATDVATINLTGNEFANAVNGNAGGNTLIGGGGADTLTGGGGNDLYRVEEAGDRVIEAIGGGSDAVYAVNSYTLGAGSEVELLSAIDPGSAVAMDLTGNEFANRLYGTAGVNVLIGGGGADILFGGGGNDIYRVEEAGDAVVEAAGGGFDSVYAVNSYTLAAGSEVELLSAIDPGSAVAMDLTGNEFANRLYGTAGFNVLIGGGGADILFGGGGNDIYRVEEAGDIVVEAAGGGADSVYAVTSYTLAAGSEVELLSAIDPGATGAMDLTGNDYANRLYGNAGGNVLIGGGGADTLTGGAGNDIYRVEEAGDIVVEAAGGGADSVYAVTSYTLAAGSEIELLSAIDPGSAAAMDLTGNELGNRLYGNAGVNLLDGKSGSDVLTGGAGADFFAFTTALGAGNVDTLADFVAGSDKIRLDDAVFTAVGGLGALNANAFVTGSAAVDADDRIVYNSATGQLFYDADGSGGGAAILFATLAGAPALTASDFQVI